MQLCGPSAVLPWIELEVFYSICSTEQLIGERSFVVGTVEMSWAQLCLLEKICLLELS